MREEIILFVLLAIVIFLILYHIYDKRKTYRDIDRLLDAVLSREEVTASALKEGEFSTLIHKINRIREVLEKQIERAEEEKEQVKMLVSNMSHQFKTPLASLAVYTEILSGQELNVKQRAEAGEKVKKQIEKLDWIVISLTKMVKLEQDIIEFEAGNHQIGQTILDAVDAVYAKIEGKGIQLILEPYEDCFLYHNRRWTAEVFVNLLENAVKYTDGGGTVRIEVHPYEMHTEIRFIDDGCGIRKEEMTQIFKRFYRSREAAHIEGSGIGLYLSNLILEKEKGYMTVKSVYGEGSCFSVFLQNCKK